MTVIPETHRDLLEKPSIWHVATVGPNGEPQVSPVWADYDGTHIRFPHKIGRQKWRNLNRNNQVEKVRTLLVIHLLLKEQITTIRP